MLFREDNVARADADAIRKGVGFYRWTHDIVEITGKDALEVLQKIYISNISKVAVGRSKYTASLDENGEIIAKGEISLDLTGRKAGRGAYVCRNLACFEKARKARRFERSLSCKIPDEVYEQMQSELAAADSE